MERLMLSVQHCMNPLHIYCRLMNVGLGKGRALDMARHYESAVYKKILPLTSAVIAVNRLQKRKVARLNRAVLSRLSCLFTFF
jgi:hypothetical protein